MVSKRWARIMRTSAEVWQQACLDLRDVLSGPAMQRLPPDTAVMADWFHARAGRFKQLGLKSTRGGLRLRPAMTSMLLSTQTVSLTNLSIEVETYGLIGSDLGIIAALKGLQALDVHIDQLGLDDRGAAMLQAVARLTALTMLEVGYFEDEEITPANIKLPWCLELAELRTTSLRNLSVAISGGTGDVLRLSGVPNLLTCHLLADNRSDAEFRVDSSSLAGCTKLVELTLHELRKLSLQPGCFAALPALSSLTLADCDLLAIPSAIAPLTTLRTLNLSENAKFCIDEAGIELLRGMKRLEHLDLAKPEPAMHSTNYVQALLNLVDERREEGQRLLVNVNPDLSETYSAATGFWGEAD